MPLKPHLRMLVGILATSDVDIALHSLAEQVIFHVVAWSHRFVLLPSRRPLATDNLDE
jgi:hypothetical protein